MAASRMPALFREANREFELPAPPASPGLGTSRGRQPPPAAQPAPPASPGLGTLRGRQSPPAAQSAPPASPGLGTSRGHWPPPAAQVTAEVGSAGAVPASRRCPGSEGPPAARVALAVKDMERLMREFGVDLATVTQAFLKNSGEVAAVESYLRTGRRPDGRPLWNRQDDEDLLEGRERTRNKLETKYGVENVNKRVLFRSLPQK